MSKQKHGKRYSEEQIIRILDEVWSGKTVAEVARSYGVSENTIYPWNYPDLVECEGVSGGTAYQADKPMPKSAVASALPLRISPCYLHHIASRISHTTGPAATPGLHQGYLCFPARPL